MPAFAQHLVPDMFETQLVTTLQHLALLPLPPALALWVGNLCSAQGLVLKKAPCLVSGFAVAVWKVFVIWSQDPAFSFCTRAANSRAGSGCPHVASCPYLQPWSEPSLFHLLCLVTFRILDSPLMVSHFDLGSPCCNPGLCDIPQE